MEKLKEWQDKVDELSLRERCAIFFCTLFVLYFVWDLFLMQPLQVMEKRVVSQLKQKQAEQFAVNAQIQKFNFSKKNDPDIADREVLKALKIELSETELQVKESTQQLISPKEMAVMLESVLLKVKGLELQHIKGMGGKPIVEVKAVTKEGGDDVKNAPTSAVDNAYKHGLKIVFEGDYLSTLEYIQELENLGWGFFWESLELNVKEYPNSIVSITVFTLSLDKNWIGV